jgi:hypothetical protein
MASSRTFGLAFKDGFSAFRESGEHSDVTVITRDGTEYELHAIMLARSSEFMRAALAGGYQEASTRRIKLNFEFTPHNFELLLSYFYTDRITLDDGNVIAMLALARQLMVGGTCRRARQRGRRRCRRTPRMLHCALRARHASVPCTVKARMAPGLLPNTPCCPAALQVHTVDGYCLSFIRERLTVDNCLRCAQPPPPPPLLPLLPRPCTLCRRRAAPAAAPNHPALARCCSYLREAVRYGLFDLQKDCISLAAQGGRRPGPGRAELRAGCWSCTPGCVLLAAQGERAPSGWGWTVCCAPRSPGALGPPAGERAGTAPAGRQLALRCRPGQGRPVTVLPQARAPASRLAAAAAAAAGDIPLLPLHMQASTSCTAQTSRGCRPAPSWSCCATT